MPCSPTHGQRPERREIDRRFKWRPGHDPNDDDAQPGSGWEYAKVEVVGPPPLGPAIVPSGGPDSGFPCQIQGCPHRMRIVDSFTSKEILDFIEPDAVSPLIKERILILACPNGHKMQIRESCLPKQRTDLILP